MSGLFRFLAAGVELIHGLLMVAWGLGLPLLVLQRWPRLRRVYIRYSLLFVGVSLASHALLGECVLTALARSLWEAAGGTPEQVPFIVTFTNRVAHIRPSADAAVLAWELAILAYCVLGLWGARWMPRLAQPRRPSPPAGVEHAARASANLRACAASERAPMGLRVFPAARAAGPGAPAMRSRL